MNKINSYFYGIYGDGVKMTVTTKDGNKITGVMYGSDECFDVNDFFQVLVSGNRVFYCYYFLDNEDTDLSNIDYEHPCRIKDFTHVFKDLI